MKALILGASGFVGRRILARLAPEGAVGTYAARAFEGGLAFNAARQGLADLLPQAPSGLTHVFLLHGLLEPKAIVDQPQATAAVNVTGIQAIAAVCFREGLIPVFFSTDYVFPGTHGSWTELDPPAPLTAYGRQKAQVEAWFAAQSSPSLVLRLSKVVSGEREPRNILAEWLAAMEADALIRCADDQVLSPLSADDATGAAIALARTDARGLFNLAGPRAFTRLALLRLLAGQVAAARPDIQPRIAPCRLADIGFDEPRPLDTSLNIDKLQRAIGWSFKPMADLCAELVARPAE